VNYVVVGHELGLGFVVHAESGEGIVAQKWYREAVFVLVAVALLDRDDEFVVCLGGSTRELERGWRDASVRLFSAAAVGNKEDEREVHGDDLFGLPSGCAAKEKLLLADEVCSLPSGGAEMSFREAVGVGVDGFSALKAYSNEGDGYGHGIALARTDLDLAFDARLCQFVSLVRETFTAAQQSEKAPGRKHEIEHTRVAEMPG
jgi:hypothetical protein